jgi:hypothetical protein
MSRTHLRALLGAFVAAAIVCGAFLAATPDGDAESGDLAFASASETGPGGPDDSLEVETHAADAELVIDQAQRLDAFARALEAHEAEQARAREAEAQAEQAAALAALAQAEREASAGIPDAFWDRMAQCETGGDWSMVGSRYSGGLGFYNGTWDSFGGREFAARAGQATREQQIVVANRVANGVGLSGWGCLSHVGRP